MAKWPGKKFEEDLMRKADEIYDVHRIRDVQWYFGSASIADFAIFNWHIKIYLEAKTTQGKSLPFGNISDTQRPLQEEKWKKGIDNLYIGFVVNFRKRDNATFYVDYKKLWSFRDNANRKSFPLKWFQKIGTKIPCTLRRSRYDYDLSTLFYKLTEWD